MAKIHCSQLPVVRDAEFYNVHAVYEYVLHLYVHGYEGLLYLQSSVELTCYIYAHMLDSAITEVIDFIAQSMHLERNRYV